MAQTIENIETAKSDALDITPLHWFIERETERLREQRESITAKITAGDWNLLNTFDAADFVEIVGAQGSLAQLTSLLAVVESGSATPRELRDEWERMANRKLQQFPFVATNSSQVHNIARSYDGSFWARAVDALKWVS